MIKIVEKWYSSLRVADKERIASKIKGGQCNYPYCTDIWNNLDDDRKERIYKHCTDKHGQTLNAWQEGDSFSY